MATRKARKGFVFAGFAFVAAIAVLTLSSYLALSEKHLAQAQVNEQKIDAVYNRYVDVTRVIKEAADDAVVDGTSCGSRKVRTANYITEVFSNLALRTGGLIVTLNSISQPGGCSGGNDYTTLCDFTVSTLDGAVSKRVKLGDVHVSP